MTGHVLGECPQRPSARVAIALVICLLGVSCGDDDDGPTPTPTFTLAFAGETTTPIADTFWLELLATEPTTNRITIRLNAHFPSTAFSKFRGSILFDEAVLRSLNYADGTFLQQGGAVVDTSVTISGNRVNVRVDRPDSLPGVSGSGTVLVLRFTPAAGVTRGASSPLQWDDAHAYAAGFTDRLVRTYNGTVTVH